MIRLFIALMLIACCAQAEPYVQIGATALDSGNTNGRSLAVEAGYQASFIDASIGVAESTLRLGSKDYNYGGLTQTTSAHIKLIDSSSPLTAFAAYQIYDGLDNKLDGRYAFGVAYHAGPAKISVFFSPTQNGWHGVESEAMIGLSIKMRLKL